jgi:hypothetical protein
MNRLLDRLRVFPAHLLWFLSCLPGLLAFLMAARRVQRAQFHVLTEILKTNAGTAYGEFHNFRSIRSPDDFAAIPLSEYEDYAGPIERVRLGKASILTQDPVEVLQPTSGSTAATKLIPYTKALRRAFEAAVDPWIASMYLAYPAVLFGPHYWSISPNTLPAQDPSSRVRVGFTDDAEYLARGQRFLARTLFAVPSEVAQIANPDLFEHLTLLFLLRERNLRLISVWHPSFLCLLMRAVPARLQALTQAIETGTLEACSELPPALRATLERRLSANPARAKELRGLDATQPGFPGRIWPHLRVISCWTDGWSEPWIGELGCHFPRTAIQAKGLIATEGIVSFPIGRRGRRVCAVRSHFIEFIDTTTEECKRAWEIAHGRDYSVVLTTQGGLYRYRLHDRVRVTGFFGQAPCLEFISRDNLVSDLVGEKLNGLHVEESIRSTEADCGVRLAFAMLAPVVSKRSAGYVLFAKASADSCTDWQQIRTRLETELNRNFHYRHACERSQLQPLRIFRIQGDADRSYRWFLEQKGAKAGDIKFCALSRDAGWESAFEGEYIE